MINGQIPHGRRIRRSRNGLRNERRGHRQRRCLSCFRALCDRGRKGASPRRPCQERLCLWRAYRGFNSVKRACKTPLSSFRTMRRVRPATPLARYAGGGQEGVRGAHHEEGGHRRFRAGVRFGRRLGVSQQARASLRQDGQTRQDRARVFREKVASRRAVEGLSLARRVGRQRSSPPSRAGQTSAGSPSTTRERARGFCGTSWQGISPRSPSS